MTVRLAILGVVLIAAALLYGGTGSDGFTVAVLDVGQGDSILVRTENGTDILVDTGRGRAAAEQLGAVLPVTDRTVELLVLTHPDADHIGGTPDVLERYEVDQVWVSGAVSNTATDRAVAQALGDRGLTPTAVHSGMVASVPDGTRIEVLWPRETPGPLPPAKASAGRGGTNDQSVILRITYQGFCILLTGDASDAVEVKLLEANSVQPCGVLKVGHHGSRYSSSDPFLAALKPVMALVSVGAGNSYGHPAPAALRRLEKFGSSILRTDQRGTVTLSVAKDGSYRVKSPPVGLDKHRLSR